MAAFYSHWEHFATSRSCAAADKYDVRQMVDRRNRRAAEKENEKARAAKRKLEVACFQNSF